MMHEPIDWNDCHILFSSRTNYAGQPIGFHLWNSHYAQASILGWQVHQILGVELKPIPDLDYGDHYIMEEFIEDCESGGFIDYDGYGNYATETQMSDKKVWPSDITSGEYDRSWTHVVWFNR